MTVRYLFDTHALIFWQNRGDVSAEFLRFFDQQAQQNRLFVSSISFWETALLVQKQRVAISDVLAWKNGLLTHSGIQLLDISADEMIASAQLPFHHRDPFDRALIAQAQHQKMTLVTRDAKIGAYSVEQIWL